VDIGPKPMRLRFTADGQMLTPPSHLIEIQLPAILDLPGWPVESKYLAAARAAAAQALHTLAVMPARDAMGLPVEQLPFVVPLVAGQDEIEHCQAVLKAARLAQVGDGANAAELAGQILAANPGLIVSVRMTLGPASADRILELVRAGLKVFHLCADLHGRERLSDGRPGRH